MTRSLIASPWRLLVLLETSLFGWRSQWTSFEFRQRRLGRATRVDLRALGARTLHDLGIHPHEIPILAARIAGGSTLGNADHAPDHMRL